MRSTCWSTTTPSTRSSATAPGWTLIASEGSERCWSTGLLAHGADARTPEADARAVAERVLAAQGIRVQEWRSGATGAVPIRRAQTA